MVPGSIGGLYQASLVQSSRRHEVKSANVSPMQSGRERWPHTDWTMDEILDTLEAHYSEDAPVQWTLVWELARRAGAPLVECVGEHPSNG